MFENMTVIIILHDLFFDSFLIKSNIQSTLPRCPRGSQTQHIYTYLETPKYVPKLYQSYTHAQKQ